MSNDINSALGNFYGNRGGAKTGTTETTNTQEEEVYLPFNKVLTDDLDNDELKVGIDTLRLPSKGMFYKEKIGEIVVEYMTSKDEDILTTPALVENNTMIDVLLKSKIKTKGINVEEMLAGDKNAVLVFLRSTSYGHLYDVVITDPYTGQPFKTVVDLRKLRYKEIPEFPDANLHYSLILPRRNKLVKFKILSDRELKMIFKQAESQKEAKGQPFMELLTMRLKAAIVEANGKTDRAYINKFVDTMPVMDCVALRKKIDEVTPDVDYSYDFVSATGGYTFTGNVSLGGDFFFPKI